MIDFACKRFHLNDVIKCSLGLNKTEFQLLVLLLKHSHTSYTTRDLAKLLSVNLTTIQRAVKNLAEKGVVLRTQTNFSGGGYEFQYEIKGRDEIRKKISTTIHAWANKVDDELRKW